MRFTQPEYALNFSSYGSSGNRQRNFFLAPWLTKEKAAEKPRAPSYNGVYFVTPTPLRRSLVQAPLYHTYFLSTGVSHSTDEHLSQVGEPFFSIPKVTHLRK